MGWSGQAGCRACEIDAQKQDLGAIPIGENDRLIGMVTDRDIVCKGLARGRASMPAARQRAM